jgi:hypothetical protein
MLGFANLYNKKDIHPTKDAIKRYEKVVTSSRGRPQQHVESTHRKLPQQALSAVETLSRFVENKITKFV